MTEDERERLLRAWHADGSYLGRLWESLELAREARGHEVVIVEREPREELLAA